jgi:hypothetical protein
VADGGGHARKGSYTRNRQHSVATRCATSNQLTRKGSGVRVPLAYSWFLIPSKQVAIRRFRSLQVDLSGGRRLRPTLTPTGAHPPAERHVHRCSRLPLHVWQMLMFFLGVFIVLIQ